MPQIPAEGTRQAVFRAFDFVRPVEAPQYVAFLESCRIDERRGVYSLARLSRTRQPLWLCQKSNTGGILAELKKCVFNLVVP